MSSTKSSLFRKGNWSMVSVRVRATSDTQCGHQRRGPIRIQLLAWLAHRAYDAPSCFFQRRHHRQLDKIETAENCLSRRARCHLEDVLNAGIRRRECTIAKSRSQLSVVAHSKVAIRTRLLFAVLSIRLAGGCRVHRICWHKEKSGSSLVSAEELVVLLLELLWLQKRINPLQVSKPTLVESGSSLVSAEELVLLLLELLSLQKRINPMLELLPPSRRREMVVLPLPWYRLKSWSCYYSSCCGCKKE